MEGEDQPKTPEQLDTKASPQKPVGGRLVLNTYIFQRQVILRQKNFRQPPLM